MTLWFLLRAWAVWLLGMGLLCAGFLTVLWCSALVLAWQFAATPGLDFLSGLPSFQAHTAWLTSLEGWPPVYVWVALVVPGLIAAGLGMLIMKRQRSRIRIAKMRREDARRRVQQYRQSNRVEPFIGPGDTAEQPGQDALRRRVA